MKQQEATTNQKDKMATRNNHQPKEEDNYTTNKSINIIMDCRYSGNPKSLLII